MACTVCAHERRVHIVGPAGSGKTTLARKLGAKLAAPRYDLDNVIYEGGSGSKRPMDVRLSDVSEIAALPEWITEGSYLWWATELFRAADCIIWLDPPAHVAISRIITRHVKASLAGSNQHPGVIKLFRFVWRYRKYYLDDTPDAPSGLDDDKAGNRAATIQFLNQYEYKLLRCRTSDEVNAIVTRIGSDGS